MAGSDTKKVELVYDDGLGSASYGILSSKGISKNRSIAKHQPPYPEISFCNPMYNIALSPTQSCLPRWE